MRRQIFLQHMLNYFRDITSAWRLTILSIMIETRYVTMATVFFPHVSFNTTRNNLDLVVKKWIIRIFSISQFEHSDRIFLKMSTTSLFRKPFSPKKAPPRQATTISPLQMDASERSREFGLDYNHAHMLLGTQHFQFDPESGEWFDGISVYIQSNHTFKFNLFVF